MKNQTQSQTLQEQKINLELEDLKKLLEIENESNGYLQKNFSGFVICFSLDCFKIELGGEM